MSTSTKDIQRSLQILSSTTLDAQGAANAWAGTSNRELLGALNYKAGTSGLSLNKVCNLLAGTTGLDAQGALQVAVDSMNSGPALWSPPVAGYDFWISPQDTSKITSSGGLVSSITDQGSGGTNATASAGARPQTGVDTINSLNVLTFNGTANWLGSTAVCSLTAQTWFAVVKCTNFSDYRQIIGGPDNGCFHWRLNASTGIQELDKQASAGIGTSATGVSAATASVIAVTRTDTAGWAFYLNSGTADASGTSAETWGANSTVMIGAQGASPAFFFIGQLGDVLRYPSVLSGANITTTINSLKTAYGL